MRIFPLLLTVFIDSLGFGLVFPIFSPMIVSNEEGMFSPEVSLVIRGLIFGLLVSSYCIGQFFGSPLLGALSDKMGRKKVLVWSMWMAFLGYIMAGLGVIFQNLWLLFLARIVAGVSAGNFAVAQSFIADVSTKDNKTKNFGLVGMSCWSGFVIGPFLGGKFAAYGFTFPFAIAALICLFNALLLLFRVTETHVSKNEGKIQLLAGVYQIRKAFTAPELRGIFGVMFIISLGWGFFTEFSPIFLIQRLGCNTGQIANFYAWVGLWIATCQGLLIRPLLKRFNPKRLMAIGIFAMGLLLPFMLAFKGYSGLFLLVPFIAFAQALIFPNAATLVSNLSSNETQGEILGIHNSVQWAAIAFPPLFSGSFVALYPHLPITVGSISMFVAFVAFIWIYRTKVEEKTFD